LFEVVVVVADLVGRQLVEKRLKVDEVTSVFGQRFNAELSC